MVLPRLIASIHDPVAWEEQQDASRCFFCNPDQRVSKIDENLVVVSVLKTKVEVLAAYALAKYCYLDLFRVNNMRIFKLLDEWNAQFCLKAVHRRESTAGKQYASWFQVCDRSHPDASVEAPKSNFAVGDVS